MCGWSAHRSMALADETSLVVMLLSNQPVTDSTLIAVVLPLRLDKFHLVSNQARCARQN